MRRPNSKRWRWQAVGASVRGASHLRSGTPNQDCLKLWLAPAQEPPAAIAAVSDGHGSHIHFRSDRGARFAVDSAVRALIDHRNGKTREPEIAESLVAAWREAVSNDVGNNPFQVSEWDLLEQQEGPKARADVEDRPEVAYGATILATLATESSLLYLQLGDGDILEVHEVRDHEKARVARVFWPERTSIADATHSLCEVDASGSCRIRVENARAPAAILLSTDGYVNSFSSDSNFLQIGSDYLRLLRSNADELNARLETFLKETSEEGSGDDITLALIERRSAAPPLDPGPLLKLDWWTRLGLKVNLFFHSFRKDF